MSNILLKKQFLLIICKYHVTVCVYKLKLEPFKIKQYICLTDYHGLNDTRTEFQ